MHLKMLQVMALALPIGEVGLKNLPGPSDWADSSILPKYDPARVKEVGPDRAAAEWLLRCGASVRWEGHKDTLKDYNRLPAEGTRMYIEEIDATGSCIMYRGFPHLKGLQYLRKIILHDARYVDDACLYQLRNVKDSLEYLQVSSNGNITNAGLMDLCELQNLKELLMYDLPAVTDREMLVEELRKCLSKCHVEFPFANARD